MKNWPKKLWALFIALILFIVSLIVDLSLDYVKSGTLKYYGVGLLISIALFAGCSKKAKTTHVHHYCIGAFVVMLCGY